MAYAVWPQAPWLDYGHWDEDPVAEIRNDRLGFVRRVQLASLAVRHYVLPETVTTAERQTFEAFLRARRFTKEAFLFQDPKDSARAGVTLVPGVGDGARVTFSLPTDESLEDYRHFPKQGTVVGKVNGGVVAVASVDTDARTITFQAAPAGGAAVTADFTGLRLCRLKEPPRFSGESVDFMGYQAELEEILRD